MGSLLTSASSKGPLGSISPAVAFTGASALATLGSNVIGGTGTSLPQYNYPTYAPVAPPSYVPPVVNNAAPNAQTFYDSAQMEMQDYTQQALSQESQAGLALDEAGLNAYQTAFQAGQAISSEAFQYTAAGVTLQGSPLLVMEQGRQQAQQEVNMIQKQGLTQANLGYTQAFQTIDQGRATLLGQEAQFGSQVSQWGTQEAVNSIQSITQQQQQNSQYIGQNTSNIINAYSQRQPALQVPQNNYIAQGLQGLGQAAVGLGGLAAPGTTPTAGPGIPIGDPITDIQGPIGSDPETGQSINYMGTG